VELPRNEEVESAVISRLLLDPAQVNVLASTLHPEDFYSDLWRKVYTSMQSLASANRRIDVMTLADSMGVDASQLSFDLSDVGRFLAPLEEYVGIVTRSSFRRRLILRMNGVISKAQNTDDTEALLAELHDAVVGVSTGVGEDRLVSPGTAVDIYQSSLASRRVTGGNGLTWGLPSIDKHLNPAGPGQMIVLAARPSVGKTALAEQIADHWSVHGPVLFVSLEMSLTSLIDRTVARTAGIPSSALIRGDVSDDEYDLASQTVEGRRTGGTWYLDDPFATTASVRAAAAKVRVVAGSISGVVIDYLQLLKDDDRNSEVSRVTKISRQIKAIAREFDVPILALSQLSRAVMQREDQHPQLHDLRESGAIEQDADVVLGLYRPLGHDIADLDILKQRQGTVGDRITLKFLHERVSFAEVEDIREIYEGAGVSYGQSKQQEVEW
jgi:replicative DNA helicase